MDDQVGNDTAVIELDGRRVLRLRRRYPYPIADVWSAISEPERMSRWSFEVEYEPRVGGAIRFDNGDAGIESGTVLAFDPPTEFEYEWSGDHGDWHVRFRLAADGDTATLVTFDHFLPDPDGAEYAAGWHWYLDRLAAVLAGGRPAQVETDEHFDELLAHYRTIAGSGANTSAADRSADAG